MIRGREVDRWKRHPDAYCEKLAKNTADLMEATRCCSASPVHRIAPGRGDQGDMIVSFRLRDSKTDRHNVEERTCIRRDATTPEIVANVEHEVISAGWQRPLGDQRPLRA